MATLFWYTRKWFTVLFKYGYDYFGQVFWAIKTDDIPNAMWKFGLVTYVS